jgi:quinol-cytochrome oxidoreductase complex cytochrome b subunit/coenzyme F420-reducing hydrogenase delta subunit
MQFLQRPLRWLLNLLDAAFNRLYGWKWNPLFRAGQLAVAMLVVLVVTGLYLVIFYRVGAPSASVGRIAADPWLGAWIRTLHRYATDLFVVAAVFHAIRMFTRDRSWGPRTVAWFSGLFLFGTGLLCAWTGFVMAWDSFGGRLAVEGGRLLDVLPIFSEPLSRIFAGDGSVPSAFFFVNLFLHIAVPLGIGAGLWLHVSRLARPQLMPPRKLTWGIIGCLTVASVIFSAPQGAPADPLALPANTPTDLFVAWWLPITESMPAALVWLTVILAVMIPVLIPLFTRKPREGSRAVSVVDPRLCTGCNQCPQDCPWDAITMVERDDDRPTLVAQVDPLRCVSCGICAGSCAPMGVGPVGHSGRDQLIDLRQSLLPALHNSPGQSPIVVVCCAQTPRPHRDALVERGAKIHEIPCVGNLHSSVVELLVRNGAPGVLIGGCPPRDCSGREGPKWLEERLFNDREAELQPRVDRRRVSTTTIAAGNLNGTMAAYTAFLEQVRELDAPIAEPDAEPEVICDPVPVEEEAS